MRRNNNKNDDEDLDKLDWDIEAGGDIDFEDEFGYEDDEESGVTDADRSYGDEKYSGRKPR